MKAYKKAFQPIVIEPDHRPIITRYRPQRLEDFIGNTSAVNKVKTILDDPIGKSHAFLISGPVGCGKTTLARIMCRSLNEGNDWDTLEINCAGKGGVDDMRERLDRMRYAISGKARILFLDEADRLTPEAQDALLKTLEEPRGNSYVIFCTTKPEELSAAIHSRCTRLELGRLSKAETLTLLNRVAKAEGAKVSDETLSKVADDSKGEPRTAIKLLGEALLGGVSLDPSSIFTRLWIVQSLEDLAQVRHIVNPLPREKVISFPLSSRAIESCRGVEVVIIQHKSEDGRQKATQTVGQIAPVAKTYRVVEVPGEGNITFADWVQRELPGGFAEGKQKSFREQRRAAIVADTMREWLNGVIDKPEDVEFPGLLTTPEQVMKPFSEFRDLRLPEREMLMGPWLREGHLLLISSAPGVGKTWLALEIAAACAEGRNAMGGLWPVKKSVPVVYVDGEMEPQDLKEMGTLVRLSKCFVISKPRYNSLGTYPELNIVDKTVRETLTQHINKYGVKLLILDNLFSLAGDLDLIDFREWIAINQWLLSLRTMGVAVIMIHHTSGRGDQFGTVTRTFNIDYSLLLKKRSVKDVNEEVCCFQIEVRKQRHMGLNFRNKVFIFQDGEWEVRDSETLAGADESAEKRMEIARLFDAGYVATQIAKELGVTTVWVSQVKDSLVKEGLLQGVQKADEKDGRKKYFNLTDEGRTWIDEEKATDATDPTRKDQREVFRPIIFN